MIKIIHRYFRGRWERFYIKNHWHLVLDLSLFIVIIVLVGVIFALYSYRPNFFWANNVSQPIVDLNNPPLGLTFSVATSTIRTEDGAALSLNFKNNGSSVINDLVIDLSGNDNNFTLNKLEVADNSAQEIIHGRTLVFQRIAAGESGQIVQVLMVQSLQHAVAQRLEHRKIGQKPALIQRLAAEGDQHPVVVAVQPRAGAGIVLQLVRSRKMSFHSQLVHGR